MKRIIALAVVLIALSGCTLQEINAWMVWHAGDPIAAEEYAAQDWVQAELHADWDHDGIVEPDPPPLEPAVRQLSTASSGNSCTGLLGALSGHGWDANRMAQIAWRESRCQPSASNSCCTGLFQIHEIWIPKAGECGVYSRSDLTNASKNICVAAIVYRDQGMGAWSTS